MPRSDTMIGLSTATSTWHTLVPGTSNQLAIADLPAATKNLWPHQLRVRLKNVSTTTAYTVQLGIYIEQSSGSASPLLYSHSVVIDANYDATKIIDFTQPSYIAAGSKVALAVLSPSSNIQVMTLAAGGSGPVKWFRSGGSTLPSLFGAVTIASTAPILNVWCENNVAPQVPINRSPAGGVSISTLTPTLTWKHIDSNSDAGDTVRGAQIIFKRVDTGATLWTPYFTATSNEEASATMSRTYAGPTLVSGLTYSWAVRTRDQAGLYGPYSDYQSFVVRTGVVTMSATTPAPKVEVTSGLTFAATWSHVNGLALQKARARLDIGGTVVWEGAAAGFTPATGNVASDGTLTFTQALAGMPTLTTDRTYQVSVMGQDTGGGWSSYSAYRTLRTNAVPQTPAALSPNTTQASSTRPKLTFTAQDPDVTAGYPETDLTATVRLKDSEGVVRFTRTATLVNSAAGTWQYQTTSTDEPALATGTSVSRLWDARLNDGTANGAYSAQATYVYASGPDVTITEPLPVLTKSNGPVRWTIVGTQASRTLKLWLGGTATGTPFYTKTHTTTWQHHYFDSGTIRNNQTYTVTVAVTDNAGVVGTNPAYTFTTSFPTPPAPVGVVSSLVAAAGEPDPSRVLLSWQASVESPDVFVEYQVSRRFESEPDSAAVTLVQLSNINQTSIEDEHPPTGDALIYTLRQVTRDVNNDPLLSVGADTRVEQIDPEGTWEGGTILVNVVDPTIRAFLRFAGSVEVSSEHNRLEISTWAGGPALMIDTGARRDVETATFNVVHDVAHPEFAPPAEVMRQVRAMNAHPAPVSVRDGRRPRWFAVMDRAESDMPIGAYDVTITLTEVKLDEGVVM